MERLLYYSGLVLLVTMPFLFNQINAESPFEFFRLTVLSFAVQFLAAAYCVRMLFKQSPLLWNKTLLLSLAVVLANSLSYFTSVNPYLSFWGDNKLPADSLRSVLVFFIFVFIFLQLISERGDLKKIGYGLALSATLLIAHGLLQKFGFDTSWIGRAKMIYSTLGGSVSYSSTLGALTPFLLYIILSVKNKFFVAAATLIQILAGLCILYSGSRMPYIGFVAVSVSFAAIHAFKNKNFFRASLVVFALALSVLAFKAEGEKAEFTEKLKPQAVSSALESRVVLWQGAFEAWLKKPILGYGPETFPIAQRTGQKIELNNFLYWEYPWIKAHNQFVQILVCCGLTGLLLQLFLFIYLSKKMISQIFTKTALSDDATLAVAFFMSYLFMLIANITGFNFITTQLYATLFPVLFSHALNDSKQWQPLAPVSRRLTSMAQASLVLFLILFSYNTFNYWQADIKFQQSRYYREFKVDNIKSLEFANEAIDLNPDEPIYSCQKATLIAEMLRNNSGRIIEADKNKILTEVKTEADACFDKAINRDHFLLLKAQIFEQMYFDGLVSDPTPALESYFQLSELLTISPKPYLKMARIYLKLKDNSKFLENINRSLQLKPDYIQAYMELLTYYYEKSDLNAVNSLIDRLLQINFMIKPYVYYLNDLAAITEKYKDEKNFVLFKELIQKTKN